MGKYWGCLLALCLGLGGCGLLPQAERIVQLPVQPPGMVWRSSDVVWRLLWHGGERWATGGQEVVPVGIGGAIAAVPYTRDGFRIGPSAGSIARWAAEQGPLTLSYEEGWIAEVAVALLNSDADLSRVNLERLQTTAMAAQAGHAWMLSSHAVAQALLTGTLAGEHCRPARYPLVPGENGPGEGWLLAYPPQPELPASLPGGTYLLWHQKKGAGWLEIDANGHRWQRFPAGQ